MNLTGRLQWRLNEAGDSLALMPMVFHSQGRSHTDYTLDQALRRGLAEVYPALAGIHLVDYKVRILDGRAATSAVTRVMLTSADADGEWTTVGVSDDIVTASWEALTDGVAFGLLRAGAEPLADEQLAQPGTPERAAGHEISEAV